MLKGKEIFIEIKHVHVLLSVSNKHHSMSMISILLISHRIRRKLKQSCTGPRNAVGNMSGNRCESDCRSRGPIPARSHTFVEIDHEIISTVILLHSTESFKKGCCQLQAKVCALSTG